MGTLQGGSARCSGMSHTIDYTRNKVTLTVPRSCLGRPRWVEVAESTVRVEDTSSSSTDPTASLNLYIDDAFSPYFTSNTHWSPKVHRG
jgi:hypothetical protein